MSSQPESLVGAQREVHRKLGRNLFRIQQLEVLLKAMVTFSVVGGESSDPHAFMEKRKRDVGTMTLGRVAKDLTTGLLVVPKDDARQTEPEESAAPSFHAMVQLEMSPEEHRDRQKRLEQLVRLRNELVHHFVESYDITTLEGCARADAYLDDCFRVINEHGDEAKLLALRLERVRRETLRVMESEEFENFFVHGILPGDAGVEWGRCTIVELLRDAENEHAVDGWTPLEAAIKYIAMREPGHAPRRYGCSSWRQVLHESKQFHIRREQANQGVVTVTWYRSRKAD